MIKAISDYEMDAMLNDGTSIRLRALRRDDTGRLLDLFEHLSSRSVYFRFFRPKRWITEQELAQLTDLDFEREMALVATFGDGPDEKIVGLGRYSLIADAPDKRRSAEVAFAVADEHQGRGIGTALLENLAAVARLRSIAEFEANILSENCQMMRLLEGSGFRISRSEESGVIHISFPTAETEEYIRAREKRRRRPESAKR